MEYSVKRGRRPKHYFKRLSELRRNFKLKHDQKQEGKQLLVVEKQVIKWECLGSERNVREAEIQTEEDVNE